MRFSCNTSELMDGLSNVTRALAARPSKQILEGVLIETRNDGISLTCTDGNLTIRSHVDAQVSDEGSVVLPGRLFTEFVHRLPGGDVDISVNDKMGASIRCQNSRTTLAGMLATEFPAMKEIESENTITLSQKKLKEMIGKVVFAIATDENRQILTGCLMEINENQARLVGLDGFRLALQRTEGEFSLPEGKEQVDAIVPGKVMNELGKIMEDTDAPVTFRMDGTHLMASFGKTELVTVLLAGEYINYKQILPADWQSKVIIRRDELSMAIDRASLMAREGKNNLIRMRIDDGMMNITSNAEMGDVLEELPIRLEGKTLNIAFNARYISDVIRNIDDEELCMCFNSNVSPCVICPPEGDSYLYLVLPVRVFS